MNSAIAENVTPKSIPDAMNNTSEPGRNSPSAPHANDVTNAVGIHAGSRRAAHSLVASTMTPTEIAPAAIGSSADSNIICSAAASITSRSLYHGEA